MPVAKIYLPTGAENYAEAAEHVRQWFGYDFGGWTEWAAAGGWIDDGETVTEPVTVFETVGDDPHMRRKVRSVAVGVYQETDESAVLAVVDGEKILVDHGPTE